MPIFDIQNTKTEEITEFFGSYDSLQEHLKANPEYVRYFSINPNLDAANYGNAGARLKPTDAFKARLNQIKKFHRMDMSQNMNW